MDLLLIGQIHERVSLTLPLHILSSPAVLRLLCLQLRFLLLVEANIDPAEQERDEQLNGEKNHDRNLARDVRRGILGLEDLGADNVADTESDQSNRIDSVLLVDNG